MERLVAVIRKVKRIRKHSAGDIQGYRLLDITIVGLLIKGRISCFHCFEINTVLSL